MLLLIEAMFGVHTFLLNRIGAANSMNVVSDPLRITYRQALKLRYKIRNSCRRLRNAYYNLILALEVRVSLSLMG